METEFGSKSPTRDEEGNEKKKTEDGEDEDEPIEEDEDDYQDDDDYYQVCSTINIVLALLHPVLAAMYALALLTSLPTTTQTSDSC